MVFQVILREFSERLRNTCRNIQGISEEEIPGGRKAFEFVYGIQYRLFERMSEISFLPFNFFLLCLGRIGTKLISLIPQIFWKFLRNLFVNPYGNFPDNLLGDFLGLLLDFFNNSFEVRFPFGNSFSTYFGKPFCNSAENSFSFLFDFYFFGQYFDISEFF